MANIGDMVLLLAYYITGVQYGKDVDVPMEEVVEDEDEGGDGKTRKHGAKVETFFDGPGMLRTTPLLWLRLVYSVVLRALRRVYSEG